MKLLTEFHGNPKVLDVGLAGAGLYARSLAYCGKYETDGFVPESWVLQAIASEDKNLPKQLLGVRLWKRADSDRIGYEIEDYLEVNKSKADMVALRENRAVAGRKGGEAKAKAKGKQKRSKSPSYSYSLSKSVLNEFKEWLVHYRKATGKESVRGTKGGASAFAARREEGRSLEELKLATVGCHGDEFCRTNGHDVPETILRASKVERYIQLASKPQAPPPSPEEKRQAQRLKRLQEMQLAARENES